jgi:hypothetical protein
LDLCAVQGSGASDWNHNWCWVVLDDRSDFSRLWLIRSLGNWLWLIRSLRGWLWLIRSLRGWTGLWWLGWDNSWRLSDWALRNWSWTLRNWALSWSDDRWLIVRWSWVAVWEARQVLVAWLSHDVSFFGQDFRSRFSCGNCVVLVEWSVSTLSETAADFRSVTFARL